MIPHNKPSLGPEEEEAALRVLESGWVAQGVEVESLENECCSFLNLPEGHAVAVSSGTAALFLSLWALDATSKRVTFPVYVCSALRHATALAGGIEVPVDVSGADPNVHMESVRRARPDIAIVPHMFGIPADVRQFSGMKFIEDCAQSFGASIDGVSSGLLGTMGVFSFYATKLLTTGGQGGMVVSRQKDLIGRIRDYREFDQRRDSNKRFNFQMTDLQAAVGRAQLKKLPRFLRRREEIFARYRATGHSFVDVPQGASAMKPVRYRAVLRTDDPARIIGALAQRGIRAIVPVEPWELLGSEQEFPDAAKLSRTTVSIPLYPALKDDEVDSIVTALEACR
ncbi:MAG: DegT/DnrJ/EryC1/StrS family aminotransferase [Bacteroidota bacterium]